MTNPADEVEVYNKSASAKHRRKKVDAGAGVGGKKKKKAAYATETVFHFTDAQEAAVTGDMTLGASQPALAGDELSAEVTKRVNAADPFRVDRITFTTAVMHYVQIVPDII